MTRATMRAGVLVRPGRLALRAVPVPVPRPDEVLIRIARCGVCGSDVSAFRSGLFGVGQVLGHEIVGRVAAAGRNVPRSRLGSRVVPGGGRSGFGIFEPGGFARYLAVPAREAHPVPQGVDDAAAAFTNPLTNVLRALDRAAVRATDRVLVLGAGTMGLLAVQALRARGCAAVAVSEPRSRRRRLAATLGARETLDPGRDNLAVRGPWNLLLDCAGGPDALRRAFPSLAPGGRAVVLSLHTATAPLDLLGLVWRRLTLTGEHSSVLGDYPAALRLLATRRVRTSPLAPRLVPLAVLPRVLAALAAGRLDAIKVQVRP